MCTHDRVSRVQFVGPIFNDCSTVGFNDLIDHTAAVEVGCVCAHAGVGGYVWLAFLLVIVGIFECVGGVWEKFGVQRRHSCL